MSLPGLNRPPTQMEIVLGEGCPLDCGYCFADRTGGRRAELGRVKRGIDAFLAGVAPGLPRVITFTVLEPFLDPELWKRTVSHAFERAAKSGVELRVIATTNGLGLDASLAAFATGCGEALSLNVSVDGPARVHESQRGPDASLRRVLDNVARFPSGALRAMCTVTPARASQAEEIVSSIAGFGFTRLDVFPDAFGEWSERAANELAGGVLRAAVALSRGSAPPRIRLLNRLWGKSHLSKVLLGPDGEFYLYEWVSILPMSQWEPFRVQTAEGGIDTAAREALFSRILDEVRAGCGERRPQDVEGVCQAATPLWFWTRRHGGELRAAFRSFKRLYAAWIGLAAELPPSLADEQDREKLRALEERASR